MSEKQKFSRRKFISTTSKGLATIPLLTLVDENAAAATKIEESHPTAAALGYVHDADGAPKRLSADQKTQFCDNCLQYMASDEDGWGPCALFPGFLVAAKGWCNVWVAKP